jgi:hypothetical protein
MTMTRYRPASEVIWREVGDEVVLCSVSDGLYFVLNATAACVWHELSAGRTGPEAVD